MRPAVAPEAAASARLFEVVRFAVGSHPFVAAREQVRVIRPSPRSHRSRSDSGLTHVSLSELLGFDRDISVDRRALEVEVLGERIALEVTSFQGIDEVAFERLRPLPPLVRRNLGSPCVLGLVLGRDGVAVALDLVGLVVERGLSEQAGADRDGSVSGTPIGQDGPLPG